MKTLFIITLCITTIFCHYNSPQGDLPQLDERAEIIPTRNSPWPLPQQYITSSSYFILRPDNFKFLLNVKCDILVKAIKRYENITFIDKCSQLSKWHKYAFRKMYRGSNQQLFNLTIKLSGQCEQQPYMNMDEQYLLKINAPDMPGEALLFSTSVWGVLRGLETFSQIVYLLPEGVFAVNTTTILDFPRFSHRGLLIDTSRHFVPKSILLQNLEAMAQTKLNVFHWHIVDDQSFPYESKTFPDLSNKGAFNKETHIYSLNDVAEIIEYAHERGIRAVVEFDTPGHTLSWGEGQPGLLTACYKKDKPDGTYGPIDPTDESNFGFLNTFFKEIARVFPENYIHLGGDEVSFACWQSNPDINDFMEKHGFGTNFAKLEEYYMQKLLDIVKSLNKSYIVWQEVFDNQVKLKPDTVVHVWKDPYRSELANVTAAGFRALLSTCWYLNYIKYGSDWTDYYNCEPYNFTGTAKQKSLVMGGEACMWGEYVDGSNLITRTWPRAAAVAERLWSSQDLTDVSAAAPRLEELRCRMIKRGLKVEPVNGPGFCECDYLA